MKVDRLAKIEVETTEEIEDDYEKRILIVTLIHEGETDYEISPQDFILASDEGNAYKQLTVSEGFGKEYLYSMLDNSKARIPDSRNTDEILQFGNVYAVPKDDKDYLFTMKTDEFETGEYWIKLHKSSNDEFILYELK
ncbi:hypothetical protein [Shouchella miscanthi]|uniref:DUF4352 domain-containing protein n=1 Tax=Shouchella miscanthi TaxID=2598861 RepID=A0ABU6NQ05_9BACI|nr:hypothetical protein [Shouchella miscanthi]